MPTQTQLTLLLHLRGLWAEDYVPSDFNRRKTRELFEVILNSDHMEEFEDVIYTSSRIKCDAKDIELLFDRALVTSGIAITCIEEPTTNQKQLTLKAKWSSRLREQLRIKSLQHAIDDLSQ